MNSSRGGIEKIPILITQFDNLTPQNLNYLSSYMLNYIFN